MAANGVSGLQIHEPTEAQGLSRPALDAERWTQNPGEATAAVALMAEYNSVLQWLSIKTPPPYLDLTNELQRMRSSRPATCRAGVGGFYWTVLAPVIVNSEREEQGSYSV